MSTSTSVNLEEYLASSYRPDCDYVDGSLIERNLGRKDHSKLQREILAWFGNRRNLLHLEPFPEQRIAVGLRRYRIPDVCVVHLPEPDEQVFTAPPYICIEILSPDDTFPKLQERLDDYLLKGVANVWVIDPTSRRAWWIEKPGHFEALDGVLQTRDGLVTLPIAELFN